MQIFPILILSLRLPAAGAKVFLITGNPESANLDVVGTSVDLKISAFRRRIRSSVPQFLVDLYSIDSLKGSLTFRQVREELMKRGYTEGVPFEPK